MKRIMQAILGLVAAGAVVAPLLGGSWPPAPAGVQVSHEYGQEYVTIGDPGNRQVRTDEFRYEFSTYTDFGDVAYEYRMARTEVTVGQWFEFVVAYDQFNDPPRVFNGFSGTGISWDFGGQGWYATKPLDFPTAMNWEYAARYANWLHNGKALTAKAFESGAYDTSTFTFNPDGTSNFQEAHSPGARFWIPTHSEWVKSVYWDPSKNGGEGGYWYYPGGSDNLLISGPPGVGQTNGGLPSEFVPIGSYPETQTPWGLLDASGGVEEYTETVGTPLASNRWRTALGSWVNDGSPEFNDSLEFSNTQPLGGFAGHTGFRLAAAVPTPCVSCIVLVGILCYSHRKRA